MCGHTEAVLNETGLPPFREIAYGRAADVLHLWVSWDRPSYNEHVRDGLYRILDLETDELLGFEIVNFAFVASKHPAVREAFAAMTAMTADRIVFTDPQPTHALRELVGAAN